MSSLWMVGAVLVAWVAWTQVKNQQRQQQVPKWLERGAVIVDVRSPGEFASGAAPKSLNIPLDLLGGRLGELDPKRPVILCCASGTRAAMAASLLQSKGFAEVLNVGSWQNLS